MKTNLSEVHAAISEIQSREKGGITKSSLLNISEISEKDWSTLKAQLFSGKIQARIMTLSPISFQLLAAPAEVAGVTFFQAITILLPVAAILLALIYSWWFVFLVLSSIFSFRIAKSFHRTVIFQGVTASETVFCFLFSRNTICLSQDGQLVYRNNE